MNQISYKVSKIIIWQGEYGRYAKFVNSNETYLFEANMTCEHEASEINYIVENLNRFKVQPYIEMEEEMEDFLLDNSIDIYSYQ